MEVSDREIARHYFEQAYLRQMDGDLEQAIELYRRSILARPTAEAHTFLGWTYSTQGRMELAIDECIRAIALDPEFGNPYNDIGAYLIELGKGDQAVAWFEKAIESARYEARHFPWYNLGRVYETQERLSLARACYERSAQLEPRYLPAGEALEKLRKKIRQSA